MADRAPAQPQHRPRRRNRRPSNQNRGQSTDHQQRKPSKLVTTQKVEEYPSHPWANPDFARSRKEHETSEFWASEPKHVSTYAGTGEFGHDDGYLSDASFVQPQGIAFSVDGSMFISERRHRIRVITQDGLVSTFAGSNISGCVNGPRSDSRFNRPNGICFDSKGRLIICDTNNSRLRRINLSTNLVSTIVGSTLGNEDGHCSVARFAAPTSVVVGPDGSLFVADASSEKSIRRIFADHVSTLVLSNPSVPRFIPAHQPHSLAMNPLTGQLYLAHSFVGGGARICTIDPSTGVMTDLPRVPAHKPGLSSQGSCTLGFAPDGCLIVADAYTNFLLRFDGFQYRKFAGSGQRTCLNGHMSEASFSPSGFAFSNGNIDMYMCDQDGHRIRKFCAPFEVRDTTAHGYLERLLEDSNTFTPSEMLQGESFVVKHSNQEWKLFAPVIRQVAPFLCTNSGRQALEKIKCPPFVIGCFLRALHGASLASVLSSTPVGGEGDSSSRLSTIMDLYMISRLTGVHELAKCCLQELKREVSRPFPVAPSLLSEVIEAIISRFGFARGKKSAIRPASTADYAKELLTVLVHSVREKVDGTIPTLKSVLETGPYKQDTALLFPNKASDPLPEEVADPLFLRNTLAHFLSSIDPLEPKDDTSPETPNYRLETTERTFEVHDWVLYARWPFFARALQFGGHELNSRSMSFSDNILTTDALELLLRYIYSGTLPSAPSPNDYEPHETHLLQEHTEIIFDAAECIVDNAEFLHLSNSDWTVHDSSAFQPLVIACRSILLASNELIAEDERREHWRAAANEMWWRAKWSKLVPPSATP